MSNGWTQWMLDHDYPLEGYPPPAFDYDYAFDTDDENERDDYDRNDVSG